MRRIAPIFVLTASLAALSCCSSGLKVPEPAEPTASDYELTLSFQKGAASTGNIIYVAWVADSDENFVQYFFTCERLDYAAFKGSASYSNIRVKATCPYWRKSLYETTLDDGVDALSGATKTDSDFTETITIPAGSPSRFTVYFEYDRSFDGNDWWTDQPAILYAADVDLASAPAAETFTLSARGWSRNTGESSGGGNANKINGNPAGTGEASYVGRLITEMRYITRHAASSGTDFGEPYGSETNPNGSACDATTMIGSITLTATKE